MLSPGEYGEVLRAIGWSLDQRLAGGTSQRVEIVLRGASISVSWTLIEGVTYRERYKRAELEALREQARALRMGPPGAACGELAESLRTIGQYLDEQRIQLERLVRLPEGHRITAMLDRHTLGQWYQPVLLQQMSEERRLLRGQTTPS